MEVTMTKELKPATKKTVEWVTCSLEQWNVLIILFLKNIPFFQGISIHEAARQGDLDTVQHLIDEGIDANIKDDDGVSITPIWTGLLEF